MNKFNKPRSYKKVDGFTLIELLVVFAMLALLAAIVGPQVVNQLGKSQTKAAKIQIEELSAALEMYKIDTNRYPTTEQTLQALVQEPAGVNGWNGPYLRKNLVPKDPWDQNYNYRYPGRNAEYEIYSLGADGAEGGEKENQDVVSWN
ncbi:MAG: type II secretion system major pseudopilin GspG [Pseudomonadota bacterium]